MKFLGEVQEVSFDGKLIVKGVRAPQPREMVTDNRRRPIGRVVRVFGPVTAPYISVEATGDTSLLSAVGKQVYVEGVEELGKGGKRRSR
jgi:rRNA processing protein Gar1